VKAMPAGYRVEALNAKHDRADFRCGVAELDAYFQRHARQHSDRGVTRVFVLTQDGHTVDGFYTLSASELRTSDLPAEYAKKLPRFPAPVTLLGRFAIAAHLQGQGYGDTLLGDALKRAMLGAVNVASWAVIVDAKAGARNFWLKREFLPLTTFPDRLFLTMATIRQLLG